MNDLPPTRPAANVSAMAERLLAHARLCEHIAHACWNEETAAKLQRMAQECLRAAMQVSAEPDVPPRQRH
jgi:hypothetical protein